MLKDYVTDKEIAEKWRYMECAVQIVCANGRIEGAVKFGRDRVFLASAAKPKDKRIMSGLYR